MMSISHVLEALEVLSLKEETRQLFNERLRQLVILSLVVLFFIGSIFFGITTSEDLENGVMKRCYLRPNDTIKDLQLGLNLRDIIPLSKGIMWSL